MRKGKQKIRKETRAYIEELVNQLFYRHYRAHTVVWVTPHWSVHVSFKRTDRPAKDLRSDIALSAPSDAAIQLIIVYLPIFVAYTTQRFSHARNSSFTSSFIASDATKEYTDASPPLAPYTRMRDRPLAKSENGDPDGR